MAFYLGIDGGGSKTACVLADETAVLARATAGGSNPVRHGEAQARTILRHVIENVCEQANVKPEQIGRTCIGIAGASVPLTRRAVQQVLSDCVSGDIVIVGDMEIALQAAFGNAPGVIVIAGTGSIAFARDNAGRTARAGGWGHAISDEGSGQWIGRRAVTALTHAHEVGEAPALEQVVFETWQLNSFEDLIRFANATPPPDFAKLLPAIVNSSEAGDNHAREVLSDAGKELARLCLAAIRRLWPEDGNVRVALAGGVFQHSALVRQAFYRALLAHRKRVSVCFSVREPVMGALAIARSKR